MVTANIDFDEAFLTFDTIMWLTDKYKTVISLKAY